MTKILMLTLLIVELMWLKSLVKAEELSTSPTPLPLTEPTPLPTPVSMQNRRALQTTESDIDSQDEMIIAPPASLQETTPVEVPIAVRRAPWKPNYNNEQGESKQFKAEDSEGNFAFGYVEDHASGGSFRKEIGDAKSGRVQGFYGLRDVDGRVRIVSYIADKDGFRADIQSNEPGFEVLDPASTTINKGKPVAVANPYTYDSISGKNAYDD